MTSLKYSKAVYAFTEQGVAMLSSVLHSGSAIKMNIAIMSQRDGFATRICEVKRITLYTQRACCEAQRIGGEG